MAQLAILYPPVPVKQDDPGTEIVSRIAGATLAAGIAVYDDPTTGKALVADASSAGKHQISGVTVFQQKILGQAVSMVRKGLVAGFDLSGLNFGAPVYLDTGGALADTANGTTTVPVGRVVGSSLVGSSGAVTKILDIQIPVLTSY